MKKYLFIDGSRKFSLTGIAVVSVTILTFFHLLLANQTELIPEEAYYWVYSQHPALSYFDHPPMVAWLIGLGTELFGNNEFGVRSIAIFSWPVSALLLFLSGRLWFGSQIAGLSVLFFCLSPILAGFGFVMTPDVPLVLFWLLTVYAISKALHTGLSSFWFLAGLGLGCAMLSKYTAVMLACSLLIFLLLSAKHRYWLMRIEPWLGLGLAIAVFSPVIVWNAQHEWASFLFQSTRTAGVRHSVWHEVGTFWGYQLLALSPFPFILFFYTLFPAIRRGWVNRIDSWNFSMSFAIPMFIIFVMASFKNKGHVNWTAPSFLTWSFAAAAIFLEINRVWLTRRPVIWQGLVSLGIILSVSMTVVIHTSLAWATPQVIKFSNAGAWKELADEVGKARDELSLETGKQAFIVGGDKLNLSAEIGFYLHDTVDTINDYALGGNGIGYRYWVDLKKFEGRPAIVMTQKQDSYAIEKLKEKFARVEQPIPIKVTGSGKKQRVAYMFKCYGYSSGN